GVCSVNRFTRLELLDRPFEGYFQTEKYTIRRRDPHGERVVPLTQMAVKSAVIRPQADAELRPGVNRIAGIAWAGEDLGGNPGADRSACPVAGVAVSTNGGERSERATALRRPPALCSALAGY